MTITNNEQYQAALNRVLEILPDTDSPELELLVSAIEAYEKDRFPMPVKAKKGGTKYTHESEIKEAMFSTLLALSKYPVRTSIDGGKTWHEIKPLSLDANQNPQ